MSKWYWIQEFGGNAVATIAIGIFTFLFAGIAIAGSATFGGVFGHWLMLPLLILWGILLAGRFADDFFRYWNNAKQQGGWALEFTGDAVMLLGLFWMILVIATVKTQGYHAFNEPNSWILWSEIPALAAMGVAVSLNWVNDIIRFRKEK